MFAPTRTWRRWHRKVNINQKRYAVASALAASSITALVLARGHQIWSIPEVPLVVATDAVEPLKKTKHALALLTTLKADPDVLRCKKIKTKGGKARLRNRPRQLKTGPLIVVGSKLSTAPRAFRNLTGVQVTTVFDLNLLKLAPGGHLGRFIIWTRSAFEQLDTIFGSADKPSLVKHGYFLPRPICANPDVRRIIQSDPIQALRSDKPARFVKRTRHNFLKNHAAMEKINPYSAVYHKLQQQSAKNRIAARLQKATSAKPAKKSRKIRKVLLKGALSASQKEGKKGRGKRVLARIAARRKYKTIVFGK